MHHRFNYNPDTGMITRKTTTGRHGRWKAGTALGSSIDHGYLRTRIDGKLVYQHRLAWFLHYGYWPEQVDHINGNRSDNRLDNLRETTQSHNMRNASKRSDNTSGCTGVQLVKGKWRAFITTSTSRNKTLGEFDDFCDACFERWVAEAENGYTFRHGGDS